MKKKFNWKSLVPLALTIALPLANAQLAPVGLQIKPAFILPLAFLQLPISFGAIFGLVQAGTTLAGGLFAHGAFYRGAADITTNYQGVIMAIFTLAASVGFHASPEVQTAIGGFAAALIATFSAHPEHDENLAPSFSN